MNEREHFEALLDDAESAYASLCTTASGSDAYKIAHSAVISAWQAAHESQAAELAQARAQFFQAGFVGSHRPNDLQIVHYAGDDVTCVAEFSRKEDRDYFLSLLADRAIRPAAGMVSVPIEPTSDMCAAGYDESGFGMTTCEKIYKAMIAASQENSK